MGKSKHKKNRSRSQQKKPKDLITITIEQKLQDRLGAKQVVITQSDGIKMSDVLEAFVQPFYGSPQRQTVCGG